MAVSAPAQLSGELIAEAFAREFAADAVTLVGGAAEPHYCAPTAGAPARLYFTADFPSSALHEAAHWCLAGTRRRALDDFGYPYVPAAARSAADQLRFEASEVRVQALEWLFSIAAGVQFHVSVDNLHRESGALRAAVLHETRRWLTEPLPPRAQRLRTVLAKRFGGVAQPDWDRLRSEAERV